MCLVATGDWRCWIGEGNFCSLIFFFWEGVGESDGSG
jgi:hypothetical protein